MATYMNFVYLGSDNAIKFALGENGAALSLTPITRVTLLCQDKDNATAAPVLIDSSLTPAFFNWTANPQELVIDLGNSSLVSGKSYFVTMKVYDATNTDGVRWTSPPPPEGRPADKLDTLILVVI